MAEREDGQWWLDKYKATRGQKIHDVTLAIWQQQAPIRDQMLLNLRLYGEYNVQSLTPRAARQHTPAGAKARRACLNGTAAVTDTWVSLLTDDEVKFPVQTTGASWEMRQRAEVLQTFLDGCRFETDWEDVDEDVSYDTAKCNPGWAYFYEDDSDPENVRMGVERVPPWEILIDKQDATYRKPCSMYRIKFLDRSALMAEYPEHAEELRTADAEGFGDTRPGKDNAGVDLIPVVASWHLPRFKAATKTEATEPGDTEESVEADQEVGDDEGEPAEAPKVGGGRYCITIGKLVLVDEDYDELFFPFEPMWIKKPTTGMIGEGIPEALSGLQHEVNILGAKFQRSAHLMGTPHWLIPREGQVNTGQIDNQIGSMIRYSNGEAGKPTPVQPPSIPADLFQRESTLISRMFSLYGVPEQLAAGQSPTTPDASGESKRVSLGISSKRFKPSIRERRRFTVRSARQFIRLANRIAKRRPDFFVRASEDDMARTIRWADARMEESEYILRLDATNMGADDIEGVIAETQDWVNAGTIDQDSGLRLIAATGNRPDLKAYCDERYASYNWSMRQISKCLDGAQPDGPNGFVNFDEAIRLANSHYLIAQSRGCPQTRLDALSRWTEQVTDAKSAATPPPPPPPPGAPPTGAPKPGGPMAVAPQMAPPPPNVMQ